MSDMNAALKDVNNAIKLSRTAENFVNRGVIYQVRFKNNNTKNLLLQSFYPTDLSFWVTTLVL